MEYILTGSRVYGGSTDDSDLDIVMNYNDALDFKHELTSNGITISKTIEQEEYGDQGGFYFDLFGIEINIIIAESETAFAAWRYATGEMFCEQPIADRDQRVKQFNFFYDLYMEKNKLEDAEDAFENITDDPDIPF